MADTFLLAQPAFEHKITFGVHCWKHHTTNPHQVAEQALMTYHIEVEVEVANLPVVCGYNQRLQKWMTALGDIEEATLLIFSQFNFFHCLLFIRELPKLFAFVYFFHYIYIYIYIKL